MKLTGILAVVIMTAAAWAQNPDAIDNAHSVAKSVQQIKTNQTNAALDASGTSAPAVKPAPGSPAASQAKTTPVAAKPAAVTTAKQTAPPASAAKPVASAPKSAASTSSKPVVAQKASASPSKPAMAQKASPSPKQVAAAVAKNAPAAPAKVAPVGPATTAAKPHDAFLPKKPAAPALSAKAAAHKSATKHATTKIAAAKEKEKPVQTATSDAPKAPKPEEKKWAMSGKRDPFFSPVVQQQSGSGCSTGKKCLEIGTINVRGVVKSDSGFIAVVTNNMNKAYFLHENDPVFNGFVVRITGDSVVFSETVQDKLGKTSTHEVVKHITTPAV
jgi:Tfp pilus assembly protein PilP